MRMFLKHALICLSASLLLSAGCGIEEETHLEDADTASTESSLSRSDTARLSGKSFTITDTDAVNLWTALINGGAKVTSIPDVGLLKVATLRCSLPKSGTLGIASCDLTQSGATVSAAGPKARAIINVLSTVGVKGLPTTTSISYSVKPLECARSYFIGQPFSNCTFTALNQ